MNGSEATQFKPGNQAARGRTVAKVSKQIREMIADFVHGNFAKVQEDFNAVKPAQRLIFIAELMPYITPKLQAIQMEANVENKNIVTLNLGDRILSPTGNGLSEGHNGLLGPVHDNGSGDQNGQDG